MCVCVCVCVCVRARASALCACMCVRIYVCNVCMHVCILCVYICMYLCMYVYYVCIYVCIYACMYIMYVCMYVRYCFLLLCVTQLEDKTFSHSRSFETDLVILPGLNLLVHNLKFISMPSNILYPVYTLFSRRLLPLLSHTFIFQKHTFPEFGILS